MVEQGGWYAGHSGDQVSAFCAATVPELLRGHPAVLDNPAEALLQVPMPSLLPAPLTALLLSRSCDSQAFQKVDQLLETPQVDQNH